MLLKIEELSHRSAQKSSFHTFSSIRGDFTRYQLEKNPRGTKEGGRKLRDRDRKRSNWVNCSRRGGFLERERGEREREEKGISRKIEGQKEKKDGDIDAIYRISRMKLVFTRDPVLHASKVYRACIYALMEFPECDAWHD